MKSHLLDRKRFRLKKTVTATCTQRFLPFVSFLVATLLLLPAIAVAQAAFPIRINEIFADGTSNYPDWIELYNSGTEPVDLQGYWLSDKIDEPVWKVRDHIVIAPKTLRVFICDSKGAYDHAGFRLSSLSGEAALFSPDKRLLDSISYLDVPEYYSIGRYPDGADALHLMSSPTMGTPNLPGRQQFVPESQTHSVLSFSRGSDRCAAPFQLVITGPKGGSIYYTGNGQLPDLSSTQYTRPLPVDSTTIIRAVAVDAEGRPGPVETRSYIFDEQETRMPVISLTSDPANLWDEETGIYADGTGIGNEPNWERNWRRPMHVDYLGDDGKWSVSGEARIFGGASRGRPQKSFAIYTEGKDSPYGIRFQLFPDRNLDRYPGFILRNGGDAWLRSQILDAFLTQLVHGRADVDDRPYRPAVVYINGSYWGLYGLRGLATKPDLLARHGLAKQKVLLKENSAGMVADNGPFGDFTPVDADAPYEKALPSMDIGSYLDYLCVELFTGNRDWVDGNIKCWRVAAPEGKWRWILYDLDRSFSGKRSDPVDHDPFPKLINAHGRRGLMFSELLRNHRFARDFCARMNTHLLTTFEYGRMERTLADIAKQIRPQIPRHFDRWRWQWRIDRLFISQKDWEEHLDDILKYGRKRPAFMLGFLRKYCGFGEPRQTSLTVHTAGRGFISIEGIPVPERGFSGPVLDGLSLRIEAVPAEGYEFLKWKNRTTGNPDLRIRGGESLTLDAVFIKKTDKEHE